MSLSIKQTEQPIDATTTSKKPDERSQVFNSELETLNAELRTLNSET